MISPMIDVIPDGPMFYILSQLKKKDLCRIAQVSRRFNTLTEQYREQLYSSEDFDTLLLRKKIWQVKLSTVDIVGIRWLVRRHPERKCSPKVLDWASQYGHTEIVRLLLKVNKPCTEYALNIASENGHTEVVILLLAANKPCTRALNSASVYGHIEIVKLLLAAGSPYSDCTKYALDWASNYGHIEIVRLLLKVNKPCTTDALDWASKKGHIEVVKLLLEAGSPYSDCTVWAVNWALENGHTEVFKLLLEANKPVPKMYSIGLLIVVT